MRKRLRALALTMGAVAAFAASAAFAVQEELLDKARVLVGEARPLVAKANDVDLDMAERKPPRKDAFKRLKEARELFDAYLTANPALEEKLDVEYVEMMVMLHGIKKDSALGELERDTEPQPSSPPPASGTSPVPSTDAGGQAPATAALPERAEQEMAAIRAFEKENPGDLPQAQKLYAKYLADFSDPSKPEFAEAADRLGKITDRIRSVFQNVAKRDFDSLSGSDTADDRAIFRLTQDLSAKDPQVRRRAARLLVSTRTRAAVFFLAREATDQDEEVATICRDGLVAIGGTSVGENLVKLYRDAARPKPDVALQVFFQLVNKGAFEATTQSPHIGRFTLSNNGKVALGAFKLLASMGKQGGRGLVVALESRDGEKRQYAMKMMAEAKYYKGAGILADRYLLEGASGEPMRLAATAAIETMGVYAVPYLVPEMTGASRKFTAALISKLTGQQFDDKDAERVRAWWEAHKPKDAE